MANVKYKAASITKFTHNAYFQRGMRQKRLGLRVSVADSTIENTNDQLCYEYGRQFSTMFPDITVREVARKTSELENRVIVAWNEFVACSPHRSA